MNFSKEFVVAGHEQLIGVSFKQQLYLLSPQGNVVITPSLHPLHPILEQDVHRLLREQHKQYCEQATKRLIQTQELPALKNKNHFFMYLPLSTLAFERNKEVFSHRHHIFAASRDTAELVANITQKYDFLNSPYFILRMQDRETNEKQMFALQVTDHTMQRQSLENSLNQIYESSNIQLYSLPQTEIVKHIFCKQPHVNYQPTHHPTTALQWMHSI